MSDDPSASASNHVRALNVRERIRMIGGEVQVSSAPGEGTSITLLAPGAAVQYAPEGPQAETKLATVAVSATGPTAPERRESRVVIRVLLADDHRMVREALAALLGREATDVEVVGQAGDGQEAVELTRRLKPDVVMMDISMPGMNGIDATRRIKSELPGVRVIGLSMHGGNQHETAMRRAGADAYLNKGGTGEELLRAIRRVGQRDEPLSDPMT